jgi:hypothetical protein
MLFYCAHMYGGKEENKDLAEEKIKKLQLSDLNNTYISPIHCLGYIYNDVDCEAGTELCLDILSSCDELIVLSEASEGVSREIELAKILDMPIRYI